MTKQKVRGAPAGQKTTTINFDLDVYAEIKRIADAQERDFGAQVRIIVREWLAARPESKGKQ